MQKGQNSEFYLIFIFRTIKSALVKISASYSTSVNVSIRPFTTLVMCFLLYEGFVIKKKQKKPPKVFIFIHFVIL